MQEIQLIQQCKNKDRFAQRELYGLYVKKVFTIVIRYVDEKQLAEEITADVFVKCFNKIDQFEYQQEGSFYAWLKKIAINECINQLRKQKIVFVQSDDVVDYKSVENEATSKMTHDEIVTAIRRLPVGYRTVFNLYAIEGFTHAEIAKHLNIAEDTSRSQLYKARISLQKQLKG